jgi:hypothetical protein
LRLLLLHRGRGLERHRLGLPLHCCTDSWLLPSLSHDACVLGLLHLLRDARRRRLLHGGALGLHCLLWLLLLLPRRRLTGSSRLEQPGPAALYRPLNCCTDSGLLLSLPLHACALLLLHSLLQASPGGGWCATSFLKDKRGEEGAGTL